MMETIIADNGSRFVIAAAAVAIGLVCLVAVLWIMRNRPSSPFIRGGKNRQPRLAVLDAAAVDTRRRLVLVRRDDVEHLIMIGGPTDIVIESRIVAPGDERPAVSERPAVIERKVAEPATDSAPAVREPALQPAPSIQSEPVAVTAVRPIARSEEQPIARVEPAAPMRVAAEQRPAAAPALSAEQRPMARPVAQPAPEVIPSATAVAAPQVNLDAAVSRPTAMAQPVQPQPIQMQPTQLQRPAAVIQSQPVPTAGLSDFERLLDAEISGDLQRLGPATPVTPENRAPTLSGRQEPTLGAPVAEGAHKEPTIEEEMNRMLADISAGRKP
ncbi:flagellar biosynthetic protein FliO [Ensifer adhaerens]|uniref:flagellar biosynthetic protein FliO n=1 Tax=Ensifer adhaerens TaxID=106592 RepID=UPI00098F63CF|nr:flagellar biosynthetic protein FliO [Ensifer adhaerens]